MLNRLFVIMFVLACMGSRRTFGMSTIGRSLPTVSKGSTFHPGVAVYIPSGERGVISSYPKGGWWAVDVNGAVKKVRGKDMNLSEGSFPATVQRLRADQEDTPLTTDPQHAQPSTTPDDTSPYQLRCIDTPPLHASVRRWVIFSDLHVKSSSITVCEEVLRNVHEAAVSREAGVIFLGDFWHVRGALSVDLLNRVLNELSKWKQPVIMIPGCGFAVDMILLIAVGNHDQVTLGGDVHALEPLRYAFQPDHILMISEPVVLMGALWVPYRRDHQLLRGILTAGARASNSVPATNSC